MDFQFSSIPVSKANRMAKSNIKVGVCVWRGAGGGGGDGGESIRFWFREENKSFTSSSLPVLQCMSVVYPYVVETMWPSEKILTII